MMELHKMCELNSDKVCDDCNMCNICDLDENKICDNCGKCLGIDSLDYSKIMIDGVVENESEAEEYILNEETLGEDIYDYDPNIEFIEDIPEVKKECEEKLAEIFNELNSSKSHNYHHDHDCECGCDDCID